MMINNNSTQQPPASPRGQLSRGMSFKNLMKNSNSISSHHQIQLSQEVKTRDVYGFEVDAKRSPSYRAYFEKYSSLSQRQTVKTTSLIEAGSLKKWNCPYARGRTNAENKDFAKVAALIYDGLPSKFRGEVWLQITGVNAKVKLYEGVYESLLEPYEQADQWINSSASTIQIEKDVPRTFPGYTWTPKGKLFQPSLRRLLLAYAMRNPRLGYCQSMNFIAGGLLLFLEEAEAFWMLCFIVEELLPDYFTKNIIGPQIDAEVLSELIAEQLPSLKSHFDAVGVNTVLVSTQWFMCLFIRTLPNECAFRVWDALFLYGPQILFEVGLAILKTHLKELMTFTDMIDIVTYLGDSLTDFFDCTRIWEASITHIDHKRIASMRETHKERVQRDMRMKADILYLMDILPSSKFSREDLEELHIQYASLTDVVGTGLNKATFQKVLLQMFAWQPEEYFIESLFRVFDVNHNSHVDFKELILGLSILCKGTNEEKMKMCFSLFDKNSDGVVDREELHAMLTSLYTLCNEPPQSGKTAQGDATLVSDDKVVAAPDFACEVAFYVDIIIKTADANRDGRLSCEQFREAAQLHPFIVKIFNLDHQQNHNLRISIGQLESGWVQVSPSLARRGGPRSNSTP